MEDKVKIVGEPELHDIRGNRLHLEDKEPYLLVQQQ